MPTRLRRSRRVLAVIAIATAWALASAPIAAAANATNINVILPRAGIIKGKIIAKDTGTGIVGAWVSASPTTYPATSGFAETTTGGAFTIRGLTAGKTYYVSVDPDDDAHYGGYWSTNADHFTTGAPVATPTATTAGRDIGTIKVPKGFTISGVVKGGAVSSTTTLNGVSVRLGGDEYDSTTTASGGKFAFKGLAPGSYDLEFETPSTMNYRDGVYKTNGGTNWAAPGSVPTTIVITSGNKTANIWLPTGRTVTGYVHGPGGVALPDAWVSIDGTNGAESGITDSTGKYVLKGVPNGTDYVISVDAPWPQTLQSGYFRSGVTGNFSSVEAQATLVVVNGNESIAPIRLPTGFTITGRVYMPNGTTVAVGASVSADGLHNYGYASTGTDGRFTIRGLEADTYTVLVSEPFASPPVNAYGGWVDGATATYRLTLDSAAADKYVLSPSATTKPAGNVRLRTGYTIGGTVKGGTTSSSVVVPNVSVSVSGPDYGWATTNASGVYKVVGLVPGEYVVYFSPPTTTQWERGYYKGGALPSYTRDYSAAFLVCVGPTVPCP